MKQIRPFLLMLFMLLFLTGCSAAGNHTAPSHVDSTEEKQPQDQSTGTEMKNHRLKITVGDRIFYAEPENNSSAQDLCSLLTQGPLTITMRDYGGFEKVGTLPQSLSRNDETIRTQPGDIILYQGNQISIYYDTNTWSLTRLARIETPAGLKEALTGAEVTVTFSLE